MAAKCAGCGKPAESGVLVQGKTFHPECFKCKACSCALMGVQFFSTPEGDVQCGACHTACGPKCAKCGQGMTSWVEASGLKYHKEFFSKECFDPASLAASSAPIPGQPTCGTCGKGLMGRYAIQNGKPTCDACAMSPSSVSCSVCRMPIEGGGITVMGASLHQACFKCNACSESMMGKSYVSINGKALCDPCASKEAVGGNAASCAACGGAFDRSKDSITQSMGKNYHPACFVCTKCKSSLAASGTTFKVGPSGPICNVCPA